ncbi:Hypothetical predicted protein [Octopus vulgaris]|uniref:Uncharacterized protein n=1 Tax=Octopus vulgaris TaxID=6645 RepID=A0AA36BJ81_OCTVU|nr:Hypothetical predicted protein [Octopus vulgaris]
MRPVLHSQYLPVNDPPKQMAFSEDESSDEDVEKEPEDMEFEPNCSSNQPHLLSQGDLNDFVEKASRTPWFQVKWLESSRERDQMNPR